MKMIKHFKRNVTAIEMFNLKKYCKEHNIDPAEIDSSLGSSENMDYLRSLVNDAEVPLEKQLTNWINDNPFKFILQCRQYDSSFGSPQQTADTSQLRFSLKKMAPVPFSLCNLRQKY